MNRKCHIPVGFLGGAGKTSDLQIVLSGIQEVGTDANRTWTIQVTNLGDSWAEGVFAYVTLPAGIDYVSSTGSGSYNAGTRTITWDIGQIQSGSVTRDFTFSSSVEATYNISALVEGTLPDPDLVSNTDNRSIDILNLNTYNIVIKNVPDSLQSVVSLNTLTINSDNEIPNFTETIENLGSSNRKIGIIQTGITYSGNLSTWLFDVEIVLGPQNYIFNSQSGDMFTGQVVGNNIEFTGAFAPQ